MLRGGDVAGLEILAKLAEEGGDWVLLAGGLAGLAAAVMTMVMAAMRGARLLARLLQFLLDGGEIGLGGGEIAGFQILGELRDGGCERIAALRAGDWRERSVLLAAGNQLLKRCEVALCLGQVAGLQILSE